MTFRESTIAVSPIVPWALSRIAKAQKTTVVTDTPKTADSIADEILTNWLQSNHPVLVKLWEQRKQLDKEAEKVAGAEAVPF